ncbi:hypothetical protein DNK03_00205 [Brucella anthropi]|nr:hypothetical protein DNK03_00205 [Brucella anthropi]
MVFLLLAWVGAQRCAATLAVAETGGCKAQGQTGGGGSPGLHERIEDMTKMRSTHPGGRSGIPLGCSCAAPGGSAPKPQDRPERSGGREEGPDQDTENRKAGNPDILIAA